MSYVHDSLDHVGGGGTRHDVLFGKSFFHH
jgi:hypothetical protein